MFAQVHCPESLSPRELDDYLNRGWFRMGQTIFTTNFLNFNNRLYSAIWLRVKLHEFSVDTTQQKLFKRNAAFRTEIKLASITPEKETLYAKYKEAVPFEASPSLNHLLFGKALHSIYTTYEINLYDGNTLIATGFFDVGEHSAMGITSVYDPAYKKYSLGKHLIYLKMNYCRDLSLHYFYPGYFVPGYPFFDYKLAMGKPAIQFLQLSSQQWLPIDRFSPESIPLEVMRDKLNTLQKLLEQSGIAGSVLHYEFFNANQVPDLIGADLFDFPIFLYCPGGSEDLIGSILVFDVQDARYHLMKCYSVWKPDSHEEVPGFYSHHLLKIELDLFSTEVPEEMVTVLSVTMK